MQFSCLPLALCLFGACAASLSVLPASAQVPSLASITPAQGAAQALDRAHRAKDLAGLNSCVTGQTAAILGLGLVLAGNSNGLGKAFHDKVTTLMNRYSLTDKLLNAADKSNTLPPGLAPRGHQFLADVIVLKKAYEKSPTPGKSKILGDKINGSDFPAPKDCTFHVLSPTRVQIVLRDATETPFESRLEDGQWRVDVEIGEEVPDTSEPELQTITPRAAAFIKAVSSSSAAVVAQMLKANPKLANTPPAYLQGHSGSVSDLPLSVASFHHNVQIAALLLKAGAKVNAQNDFEETALDQAAFFGGADMVTLLLAHGAEVTHRNNFGKTALHEAVEGDNLDIIQVLLAHGANVNARDDDGKTPLTLALDPSYQGFNQAAIVKLLRQRGATK